MATSDSSEFDTIYARVKNWSASDQIQLADRILRSLGNSTPDNQERRAQDLRRLVGLFAGKGPPPTDEECEQIISDARRRKYG